MKRFLLVPLLLVGCASSDYSKYVEAQHTANLTAYQNQKPLIEIEAEPGKEITGLKALRVHLPVQAMKVDQSRPSEWAGVVTNGLSVAGGVLGLKYMGQYMSNIANYDRAPNTTSNTSNTTSSTVTTTETSSRNSNTEDGSRNTNNPVSTTTTNTSTTGVPNGTSE